MTTPNTVLIYNGPAPVLGAGENERIIKDIIKRRRRNEQADNAD